MRAQPSSNLRGVAFRVTYLNALDLCQEAVRSNPEVMFPKPPSDTAACTAHSLRCPPASTFHNGSHLKGERCSTPRTPCISPSCCASGSLRSPAVAQRKTGVAAQRRRGTTACAQRSSGPAHAAAGAAAAAAADLVSRPGRLAATSSACLMPLLLRRLPGAQRPSDLLHSAFAVPATAHPATSCAAPCCPPRTGPAQAQSPHAGRHAWQASLWDRSGGRGCKTAIRTARPDRC